MIEIVLDIETIPNQNLKEFHYEILNKKIEKVDIDNIENRLEQMELRTKEINKYCSITPEFCQIICIGLNKKIILKESDKIKLEYHDIDINTTENNIMFTGINEHELITNLYKYLSQFKQSDIKIITFNGKKFDIPTILKRACLLNITPTYKFINKKYDIIYHYDIMEVLNNFYYDKNTLKLQEYAKIYGIENNDTSDGSEVYKLFKENKLSDIEKHCIEDITTTRKLYEKIKGYF
jgi:predicted PolB exonuclease-like 3'-5' exonuclease